MVKCTKIDSALKITLVETDDLDEENPYYLFEVECAEYHYYLAKDSNDQSDYRTKNWKNKFPMLQKEDLTDRELEIAKYLFQFLWDSSNGTNTGCDQDIYEDDGFTAEEMKAFIQKFGFDKMGVLEFGLEEENSVEIFWDYFSCFDLKSIDFFA